mgnify:CR=1 FL=1
MKRGRKQSNQKKIIEDVPMKKSKTNTSKAPPVVQPTQTVQKFEKKEHREVIDVKVTSKVRVSINTIPNLYIQSYVKDCIPTFLPDPKRRLMYTQNYFLDKLAVMNLKTGKIIKNLGPDNEFHKKHVLAGDTYTCVKFYYRNLHFLNEDTLIAIRGGSFYRESLLVRINLKTFHYEDIDLKEKIPELKDTILTDHHPVPEKGQIAIAGEIREILLVDPDKKAVTKRYKYKNEIIFGVSYWSKRQWIIGESRLKNPHFLIFDLESGDILKVVDIKSPRSFSGSYGQNSTWMLDYLVMMINAPRLVKFHEDGSEEPLSKDIIEYGFGWDPRVYHFSADEETQNVFCSSFTDPLVVCNYKFDSYKKFAIDTCCTSVRYMFSSNMIVYFNYKKKTIGFCRVTYSDTIQEIKD